MLDKEKYKDIDLGVSPVIGAVLMVFLVVVIAGIIGVLVFNVGQNPGEFSSAGVVLEGNESNDSVEVRYTSEAKADRLVVTNGTTSKNLTQVGDSAELKGNVSVIGVTDGERQLIVKGGPSGVNEGATVGNGGEDGGNNESDTGSGEVETVEHDSFDGSFYGAGTKGSLDIEKSYGIGVEISKRRFGGYDVGLLDNGTRVYAVGCCGVYPAMYNPGSFNYVSDKGSNTEVKLDDIPSDIHSPGDYHVGHYGGIAMDGSGGYYLLVGEGNGDGQVEDNASHLFHIDSDGTTTELRDDINKDMFTSIIYENGDLYLMQRKDFPKTGLAVDSSNYKVGRILKLDGSSGSTIENKSIKGLELYGISESGEPIVYVGEKSRLDSADNDIGVLDTTDMSVDKISDIESNGYEKTEIISIRDNSVYYLESQASESRVVKYDLGTDSKTILDSELPGYYYTDTSPYRIVLDKGYGKVPGYPARTIASTDNKLMVKPIPHLVSDDFLPNEALRSEMELYYDNNSVTIIGRMNTSANIGTDFDGNLQIRQPMNREVEYVNQGSKIYVSTGKGSEVTKHMSAVYNLEYLQMVGGGYYKALDVSEKGNISSVEVSLSRPLLEESNTSNYSNTLWPETIRVGVYGSNKSPSEVQIDNVSARNYSSAVSSQNVNKIFSPPEVLINRGSIGDDESPKIQLPGRFGYDTAIVTVSISPRRGCGVTEPVCPHRLRPSEWLWNGEISLTDSVKVNEIKLTSDDSDVYYGMGSSLSDILVRELIRPDINVSSSENGAVIDVNSIPGVGNLVVIGFGDGEPTQIASTSSTGEIQVDQQYDAFAITLNEGVMYGQYKVKEDRVVRDYVYGTEFTGGGLIGPGL
jgi:FlaG/FlaF family flagellin (archaellin)